MRSSPIPGPFFAVIFPCLLFFQSLGGTYSVGKLIVISTLGLLFAFFRDFRSKQADIAVAYYATILALSALQSIDPRFSWFGSPGTYTTGIVPLLVLAPFWFCFGVRDWRWVRAGGRVALALVSVVALLQVAGVEGPGGYILPFPLPAGNRATSTLGNPVYAGAVMALLLPLYAARYLELGLGVLGLWATGSRGAWLAAGLGVIYRFWPIISIRARVYIGAAGIAGMLGAFALRPVSDLGRLVMWPAAWEAFLMRPWSGWGAGTFVVIADIWRNPVWDEAFGLTGTNDHAHNALLEALACNGLLGLASLLAVWFGLWQSRNRGVRGGLLALACISMLNPIPQTAKALALILVATSTRSKPGDALDSWFVRLLAVLAFFGVGFLLHQDRLMKQYGRHPWSVSSAEAALQTGLLRKPSQRSDFKF